jgi:hypothetical protein
VENKRVGIVLDEPGIDVNAIGQGFGATTYGLLCTPEMVLSALADALDVVANGGVALLEVEAVKGHAPSMVQSMR